MTEPIPANLLPCKTYIPFSDPFPSELPASLGIVFKRRNIPEFIKEFHGQIINFALADKPDPIEFHRWLINYAIAMSSRDPTDFEFQGTYNPEAPLSNITAIVENMKRLGVTINPGERFSYIVCRGEVERPSEKSYEIGYFLRSLNSPEPLEIDYAYYISKFSRRLDNSIPEMFPLPERFEGIEYQRCNKSKHILLTKTPIFLISSLIRGGNSLDELSKMFEEVANNED